jgi:hypothetical protein
LFAVQKTEPWEDDKCEADMEKFVWEGSQSQRPVEQLLQRMPDKEKAQDMPEVIELYAAYAGEYHITLTALSFQTAFPLMVKINSFRLQVYRVGYMFA